MHASPGTEKKSQKRENWEEACETEDLQCRLYVFKFTYRVGRVLSFFSNRQNRDSPNPSPASECAPPRLGGRGTLAGERGGGRVPIPTRGHTLWYSIYISTLWIYLRDAPNISLPARVAAHRHSVRMVGCHWNRYQRCSYIILSLKVFVFLYNAFSASIPRNLLINKFLPIQEF